MRNWLQETVDVISFTVDFDHWVLIWPLVIALLLTMARVTANFVILKVSNSCITIMELSWK